MTNSLLSYGPSTDIIAYAIVFLLGIFVKSRIQWGRTNTDALETLTKDYQAIKELYNTKCDEIKHKNAQLITQGEEILELRARIRSFENFLSVRAPETDRLVKAIAEKLEVNESEQVDGHSAAHSQAEKVSY